MVAITLIIGVVFAKSVVTNENFQWDVVGAYIRDVSIIQGLKITLFLTVVCMVIGLILGALLAIMKLSSNPIIAGASSLYIWFFRGTPQLVQLLIWFNLASLYPVITFGIPGVSLNANELISPLLAAILGLGLHQAAYQAEIVRAGLLSIDHGQQEAAAALGITKFTIIRRIIMPQAMRVIIPPTGNEAIGMLKLSSLVSVLAVPELLYSAQIISSRTFQIIPLLIVATLWYLFMTTIMSIGQYYIERHFNRGSHRIVDTPVQRLRSLIFGRSGQVKKGGSIGKR